MANEKEKFGRWFIKNYWVDILAYIVIGVVIIGYAGYAIIVTTWGYENNLGIITTTMLDITPPVIVLIAIGLLSAYNEFKKKKR